MTVAEYESRVPARIPVDGYCLLIVAVFALFVTNLDLFLSVRGYLPLNTLILFVGVATALLAMILLAGDRSALNRFWLGLRQNRVPFGLCALWLISHVIASGRTILYGDDVDYGQIFPVFQFGVLAFGLLVAAADPDGRRIAVAARLAIVLLGASVVYEVIVPGGLGSATSRSGGFALNANIPGFIIPALLAVSLDFRRMRPVDLLSILAALISVMATLSRMGIAMLGLVIGVYVLLHLLLGATEARLRKVVLSAIFLGALTALAAGGLFYLARHAGFDAEFQARVATILGIGGVLEDPYRGPLLDHFLQVAGQHPWAGYGACETLMNAVSRAPLQLGPHNMYVRAWIDAGLAGLVIYSAFVTAIIGLGILQRSVSATLIGVLVALYGMFSHNVADNKAVIILVGVALGLSALRRPEPGR